MFYKILLFENYTALHNKGTVHHSFDVLERIYVKRDYIGIFACVDGAYLVFHSKLGSRLCCSGKSLHLGHSVFNHEEKFLGLVTMLVAGGVGVGAECYLYLLLKATLEPVLVNSCYISGLLYCGFGGAEFGIT